MLKVSKIPKGKLYLSLSGGVDSMVLADFLMMGCKEFSAIHFDHGTEYGKKARIFVEEYCNDNDISLETHVYNGQSSSEFSWSNWRRSILTNLSQPVLTAHHRDDSIESFLMRGDGISYRYENIYRPLLCTTKLQIRQYAGAHGLSYVEDPTNSDSSTGLRNKIRNELIPLMRECKINPYRFLESNNGIG